MPGISLDIRDKKLTINFKGTQTSQKKNPKKEDQAKKNVNRTID
jgi:hypothetical protein